MVLITMKVVSIIDQGIHATLITVECNSSRGLPGVIIVGLASKSIDESKERIRAAYQNSGLTFPKKRLVLNLAPSDIAKSSSGFDLALAIAIISEHFTQTDDQVAFFGELGLDGTVRSVRGIVGKLAHARKLGIKKAVLPWSNISQAKLIDSIDVYPVKNLKEAVELVSSNFTSIQKLSHFSDDNFSPVHDNSVKLSDIIGQESAKRALLIAASGRHNILLNGPPGAGKSMLASAMISLLPRLTRQEIIETTQIHSLVASDYDALVVTPPLRKPHHSASDTSIIGGGADTKPGEISLAHNGILFLDEFPEFSRSTIEALRQPLEEDTITIARAKQVSTFPASCILIATQNPCPCGYYGSKKACNCTQGDIAKYKRKLSGPILDRIDIHITVDSVDHSLLLQDSTKDTAENHNELVVIARNKQLERQHKLNGKLTSKEIKQYIDINDTAKSLLDNAADKLHLSSRSYLKTLKVARTIADIDGSDMVMAQHISEALQYRPKLENE